MCSLALLLSVLSAAPAPPAASAAQLLAKSEDAILAEPPPASVPAARNPWDRKTPPKYQDLVLGRFPLDEQERAQLAENGFVVAARFRQQSFNESLHELHTSQLPVFISTDAILHTVFRSHDEFLKSIERGVLAPTLVEVVRKLLQALPEARRGWPKEVAEDVEFYLRMARLIAVDEGITARPREAAWLSRINRAQGVETVGLFGRHRQLDFSQYQPRGHYADPLNELQSYFKLVTWLSRVELNLKSNACASSHPGPGPLTEETPREVLIALALAELAERSGTLADFEALDRIFGALAGAREDLSLSQLASLRKEAGVVSLTEADAAAKVTRAIGDRFQRTVNFHPMPPGVEVRPLPVIATLLGPRITAETAALGPLTGELDPVGWAALLGHARAHEYFRPTADVQSAVREGQRRLASAHFGDDLYSTWLKALVAHGAGPEGVQPSFAGTPAWADLRVNTSVVGLAQLRHDNLLYAAQVEEEGGCQIPDGYVEPNAETYQALAAYARAGLAAVDLLEREGKTKLDAARRHFVRLEKVMRVLATLSRQELANQPLSEEGKRWLAMVAELWAVRPMYIRYYSARYDGWYFDLYYGGGNPLVEQASPQFIADLHTQVSKVAYAGARRPELGFFVVDTGGPPRLMVGPVARGFAFFAPRKGRLVDADVEADEFDARFNQAPWSASYRSRTGERRLSLEREGKAWTVSHLLSSSPGEGPGMVEYKRKPVQGPVTFRLRGEHGEELLSTTVGSAPLRFELPAELEKTARLVSAEAEGEVVEERVHRWSGAEGPSAE